MTQTNETTTSRPTWSQLTEGQKCAAFAMNQDCFEQGGKMADEWNEFMDVFNEAEWAETWKDLNAQVAMQHNAETVREVKNCARRHR